MECLDLLETEEILVEEWVLYFAVCRLRLYHCTLCNDATQYVFFTYFQGPKGLKGQAGERGPTGIRGDPVSVHKILQENIRFSFIKQTLRSWFFWPVQQGTSGKDNANKGPKGDPGDVGPVVTVIHMHFSQKCCYQFNTRWLFLLKGLSLIWYIFSAMVGSAWRRWSEGGCWWTRKTGITTDHHQFGLMFICEAFWVLFLLPPNQGPEGRRGSPGLPVSVFFK